MTVEKFDEDILQIDAQLTEYRQYREHCLNLIASENVVSPFVLRHMEVALESRYGDYFETDCTNQKYRGTKPLIPIEQTAATLIGEIFGARHVDLRPLSGHVAGAAALLALCKPGDTVMELDRSAGGHRLAEKLAIASLINLNVIAIPFDAQKYNVDAEATIKLIKEQKPKVVILGSSLMLYPQPVREIAQATKSIGNCWLLYDASHVLGLIAGKIFQDPLAEGADMIITSTHKTFAGPQGGMILTNSGDLAKLVAASIYPALVTNHHLARIPAMAARAIEVKAHGNEYAKAIVSNAKALAQALQNCGLKIVGAKTGFTESHIVAVQTAEIGKNTDISLLLEQAGIICGEIGLPAALGGEAIRLGVQELTRFGLQPEDTPKIAQIFTDVVLKKISIPDAKSIVRKLAARFTKIHYALNQN